ncbi:protein kinase [Myxococcaceae bacterium GXIMD 01537]
MTPEPPRSARGEHMIERDAQAAGAPPDVVDPLLGKVLNERFRILETLGAGGMGRVYKAMQAPLDRLVALKVLNPQYSTQDKDPEFQKRFLLEASVTAKLRHPNTVTVIDYGRTEDGIFYIAMEYLEGLTLAQLLTQEGPLPWARALNIAQQVARSLREAHKVGLIHRDLKPANVMVLNQETDHDVVKVLDFGLVKSLVGDEQFPKESALTQAGVILGSPQYMAPEQARNITDVRSDVYSLGVVLYQMLTARPPFQAQQSIDVIFKHINEAPASFGAIWPGHNIPAEVEALVMKCLAKRPAERFQSMDEVLDAIRRAGGAAGASGAFSRPRAVSGSGPISGPVSGPAASGVSTVALDISVEEPKKSRWKLPAAILGGVVLLGAGAALLMRGPSTPLEAPPVAPVAVQKPAAPAETARPKAVEVAAAPAVDSAADLELAPLTPPPPVRFLIASEPSGARVIYGGKDMGETPLELPVPVGRRGLAIAELTFTLDGYQRTTATAEGEGPEVRFTQKLKKKASARPKGGSSGYKDDPYQ